MPDLNDKIRDLEARNARLEKMATLTDAQRVHFAKLAPNDAEQFLAMRADQRDSLLAEIAKSDPVVYTTAAGKEYRKSCPQEIIDAVIATDAANKMLADTAVAKKNFEYQKRGAEVLTKFSKGAKGDLQARIMKALDTEFTVPAEYDEAVKALKAANFALGDLEVAKGFNPHNDPTGEPQTPQAQLDQLAAEYAKTNNVSLRKAAAAVLATPAGEALYAKIPTARA